jgi:hypothetical protein
MIACIASKNAPEKIRDRLAVLAARSSETSPLDRRSCQDRRALRWIKRPHNRAFARVTATAAGMPRALASCLSDSRSSISKATVTVLLRAAAPCGPRIRAAALSCLFSLELFAHVFLL